MATYVVEIKLPYERSSSLFGVLHSTSDTLFSPTFCESDELIAHMFAAEYSGSNLLRDYTEAGQQGLVRALGMFLAEVFPKFSESSAPLPEAWRAELLVCHYDDESPDFDASDLLSWYQDGDGRADIIQAQFHAWRRAAQRAVRL